MGFMSMASGATELRNINGAAATIGALLRVDSSSTHRYIAERTYVDSSNSARNLADAVHYLCALHGRHPGVVDLAAERGGFAPAADWLAATSAAFAAERSYLTKVVVAAGPLPSTPGQAESEAAVLGQRHALEMLARSDRTGCALGAALALSLDWPAIRTLIDAAAQRFGVELMPPSLPSARQALAMAEAAHGQTSVERAMVFGAQQILVQHRGLWDLLEARQLARVDS